MPEHVVIIMTDQQRRDTLGVYGGVHNATPNLDAFAEEAAVFDRFYCATPLCVPTRTAMYTGRMPHRNGVVVNGWTKAEEPYARLAEGIPNLYEHLAQNGCNLTHVGVDHFRCSPPVNERLPGMQYVSNRDYHQYLDAKGLKAPDTSWTRSPCPDFEQGRLITLDFTTARSGRHPFEAEDFMDAFWAREAEKAIAALDPGRPQFIQALFWAPHVPLLAPEPFYSMFDPAAIELPETAGRWYEGQPASLLFHIPGLFGTRYTREEWREPWRAYLALVRMVDECIGRVISALKKKGIWDDALVIFMDDHGDMMGSHGLFQKMCMYEDAVHIPLLLKPPGGSGRERVQGLASHLDIASTICDYMDLPPLPEQDGVSLRPLVEGREEQVREEVFIEFNGNSGRGFESRALVRGKWKYMYYHGDRDCLYDLEADPDEKRNLAVEEEFQEKRDDLRNRLSTLMESTGDRIRLQSPPD